jgi:hypothetical protein
MVKWLQQGLGAGRNRVTVSHRNPVYATAGVPYLAERRSRHGETAGQGF